MTAEDMESLRSQLPDLALTISSPDLNSITQFFLSKSLTSTDENNKEKDGASMRVDAAAKEQERARAPMLFDRYIGIFPISSCEDSDFLSLFFQGWFRIGDGHGGVREDRAGRDGL